MKKWVSIFLLLIMLSGCGKGDAGLEEVLQLRSSLLRRGCRFEAVITADYGDVFYEFRMDCQWEAGELRFTVLEPEVIDGISGQITENAANFVFDTHLIAFDTLADGQLSPISGPWVLMQAVTAGYITATGEEGEYLRATIRDSYEAEAFTVELWLDEKNMPVQADILWKDRRILTLCVEKFSIL